MTSTTRVAGFSKYPIDGRRSMITRWTEEDGWPEKVGKYFMVARLRVDPQRANGVGIFRLTGWEIAVVVSDDIRRALVEAEVTGVKFTEA